MYISRSKLRYSLLILNENDHFVIKRHRERENLIKKTYAFNYHFRGYFERNPIFIDNVLLKSLNLIKVQLLTN